MHKTLFRLIRLKDETLCGQLVQVSHLDELTRCRRQLLLARVLGYHRKEIERPGNEHLRGQPHGDLAVMRVIAPVTRTSVVDIHRNFLALDHLVSAHGNALGVGVDRARGLASWLVRVVQFDATSLLLIRRTVASQPLDGGLGRTVRRIDHTDPTTFSLLLLQQRDSLLAALSCDDVHLSLDDA